MAFAKRYAPPEPLPSTGADVEGPVLDAKEQANLGNAFELAKDVAAFANHLGGTLLIGAEESNGRISGYKGLSGPLLQKTRDEYSRAVRDRCRPLPIFGFGLYSTEGVLAVNVEPTVNGPVGVLVRPSKPGGSEYGESWVFPLRVGADAHFLTPEVLPLYSDPRIRRLVLLLDQIKPGTRVLYRTGNDNGDLPFLDFNLEQNLVRLRKDPPKCFPLDALDSVSPIDDSSGKPAWIFRFRPLV